MEELARERDSRSYSGRDDFEALKTHHTTEQSF
jgi:hypothetical protein